MDLGNGLGHLTYSTLVHPGDTWERDVGQLETYVPQVKARVSPKKLSACRCGSRPRRPRRSRATRRSARSSRSSCARNDMYLYTVNAFPYGPFKGTRREGGGLRAGLEHGGAHHVHDASCGHPRRGRAAAVQPSIQSPPLGFKPKVTGAEYVNELHATTCCKVVAHMVQLEKRTGRTVTLALEPEPACFLETTEEALDYFTEPSVRGAAR